MENMYLTFHRSPDRHAHYPDEPTPPFFDPKINAWIVKDPACCERLLTSPHARPDFFTDNYAALEQRLGISFSTVFLTLPHVPLCLHGEEHRTMRRIVAEHVGACRTRLSNWVRNELPSHLEPLRHQGEVDIVRQVLEPVIVGVSEILTDVPADVAVDCKNISKLFDSSIGPRKRRRVEQELLRMEAAIRTALGPDAAPQDIGVRLALAVLGRDSLLGALGESLYNVLSANPGRRLNEIDYPQTPIETGVPYAERIVVEAFSDQETRFNIGDRIRIYLQAFGYAGSPRERARIFGVGGHVCLGKPLSLDLWNGITACLREVPHHAEIVSHVVRDDDYLFLCPSEFTVRLRP